MTSPSSWCAVSTRAERTRASIAYAEFAARTAHCNLGGVGYSSLVSLRDLWLLTTASFVVAACGGRTTGEEGMLRWCDEHSDNAFYDCSGPLLSGEEALELALASPELPEDAYPSGSEARLPGRLHRMASTPPDPLGSFRFFRRRVWPPVTT